MIFANKILRQNMILQKPNNLLADRVKIFSLSYMYFRLFTFLPPFPLLKFTLTIPQ